MVTRTDVQHALAAGGGILRLEPAGFPAPSCSRAVDFACIPTTCTRSARIAAASTSAGSRRPRTPTTAPARRLTRVSATSARIGPALPAEGSHRSAGDALLGADVMRSRAAGTCSASSSTTWGRFRTTCTRATSTPKRSGRRASPRPTTFRRSTTSQDNNFPYTFMGLEPGHDEGRRPPLPRALERGRQRHPVSLQGLQAASPAPAGRSIPASCTRPVRW